MEEGKDEQRPSEQPWGAAWDKTRKEGGRGRAQSGRKPFNHTHLGPHEAVHRQPQPRTDWWWEIAPTAPKKTDSGPDS